MFNKLILQFLITTTISLVSCKKNDDSLNPNPDQNLTKTCLETDLAISTSVSGNSITVIATGGKKPYYYSSQVFDSIYTSDGIFKDLPDGTFSYFVRDANGCVKTTDATINSNIPDNLKLPLHLSKYFLLTGLFDTGDLSISISYTTDTTWEYATGNYTYTVGNKKWGGAAFLHNESWTDSLEISADISKVSFLVKADPGLKLTLNFFPYLKLGTHIAEADGNWHKVDLELAKKKYPSWVKGGSIMNLIWEPTNTSTSVGTEYNFAIKNIVFE